MKTLFTSEAISKGARSGTVKSRGGLLNVTLGNRLEAGIETRGPIPELLFAGAYSACYHGALLNAAKKLGTPIQDSTVRAMVSLVEDDKGGYGLAVELHALLPDVAPEQAQRIMEEANQTCPYSKALRGEASIARIVDTPTKECLDQDLEVFAKRPAKTGEWSALMDESEKTTGKEIAVVTKRILAKSKEGRIRPRNCRAICRRPSNATLSAPRTRAM